MKKAVPNNRVRVQLQEGHTDIDSVALPVNEISAHMTLWALDKLHQNNLRFLNDSNWLKAFSEAHQKARRWVLSVQQGGGFEPPRGSGTAKRFEFDCDRKTYRIDIEIHGDKYADWFK